MLTDFLKESQTIEKNTKKKVNTTGTHMIYSHHMGEDSFRHLSLSLYIYRNMHMNLNT